MPRDRQTEALLSLQHFFDESDRALQRQRERGLRVALAVAGFTAFATIVTLLSIGASL